MNANTAGTTTAKQDLVITRVFDAPVEQVWQAWSDSEKVMQWWGPTYFSCPLAQIDFREGGIALLAMRPPKDFGDQDLYSTWQYRKIVPLKRIDYVHNLSDANGTRIDPTAINMPPDFPMDQPHTISFKALSPTQTELTVTEHDWPVGQMMEMSRMGMEQCLDKMAALFAA